MSQSSSQHQDCDREQARKVPTFKQLAFSQLLGIWPYVSCWSFWILIHPDLEQPPLHSGEVKVTTEFKPSLPGAQQPSF